MPEALAQAVWIWIGFYLAFGACVALVLAGGLVRRIDPLTAEAPWRVRLLLAPGMAALWPLLLLKLFRGSGT